MKTVKCEKVEFWFEDGTHIVWVKQPSGWIVMCYQHGEACKTTKTIGHLPSIENANYFKKKLS